MKRDIKNEGVYLELSADELISRSEEVVAAQIIAITKARFEFAGKEKEMFVVAALSKLKALSENDWFTALDSAQQADVVIREMLIGGSKLNECEG